MAEKIAERYIVKKGGKKARVEVRSAGIRTDGDVAAAAHGITVMKRRGYDLTSFRSSKLDKEDVRVACRIYCVSKKHQEFISSHFTVASDTEIVTMGDDITDPYGGTEEDYEMTAKIMERVVPGLIERDWALIVGTDSSVSSGKRR